MKLFIQILFILCTYFQVHSQDSLSKVKNVESYFQLNGLHTSFQDTKFSNIRYNGFGTQIELGRKVKSGVHTYQYGMQLGYSNSSPSTFKINPEFGKIGIAREFRPTLFISYMNSLDKGFSIGGRLDALDAYFRVTRGLGNNKIYYNIGSNLYVRGNYRHELNKNWRFETGAEIGLISFMRESTSFAFSAPQAVVANGAFNYQDQSTSNPLGLKRYQLRPIWNYGNVNLYTQIEYKQRWTLSYTWSLRRFSTVDNYPTTIGFHALGLRFDFIDKTKSKRKFKTKVKRSKKK